MKEIAIHQIAGGEQLAVDVFDDRGGLLLSEGMELVREHVELLERRGVLTVKVAEPEEPGGEGEPGAPDEDEFKKALGRLDHMFEGMQDDPVMRAIYFAARGMIEKAMPGER